MGVVRLVDPDGVKDTENCSWPLLTACLPPNVWLEQRLGVAGATAASAGANHEPSPTARAVSRRCGFRIEAAIDTG